VAGVSQVAGELRALREQPERSDPIPADGFGAGGGVAGGRGTPSSTHRLPEGVGGGGVGGVALIGSCAQFGPYAVIRGVVSVYLIQGLS